MTIINCPIFYIIDLIEKSADLRWRQKVIDILNFQNCQLNTLVQTNTNIQMMLDEQQKKLDSMALKLDTFEELMNSRGKKKVDHFYTVCIYS